MRFQ